MRRQFLLTTHLRGLYNPHSYKVASWFSHSVPLAHFKNSKPCEEEAQWRYMWPANGLWTFLQLSWRRGCREQGASCYIQLTPPAPLLQLCSKSWDGLSTSILMLPIAPALLHLSLQSLLLGYGPGSICFIRWCYAWKWPPSGEGWYFLFPCRPILHPSAPSSNASEAQTIPTTPVAGFSKWWIPARYQKTRYCF